MFTLNYRDASPIYEQIKDNLRKLVISGLLPKDEKLPSVRELATQLSINPNTIQRAYRELENEGYVYTIAGKGSFAAGDKEIDKARKDALFATFDKTVNELKFIGVTEQELTTRIKGGNTK